MTWIKVSNFLHRTDVDIGAPSYVRLARLDVQNPATRDTTQEPDGREGRPIAYRMICHFIFVSCDDIRFVLNEDQ